MSKPWIYSHTPSLSSDRRSSDSYQPPHRAPSDESLRPQALQHVPPSLRYSLHDRTISIVITWSVILMQACVCPIVLDYVLHNFTKIETKLIFTIISLISLISALDFLRRWYLLLRPSDDSRPLRTGRWGVDVFQWEFTAGFIMIALLFGLGISGGPNVHILSLPVPLLMTEVAAQMVVLAPLASYGVSSPLRLSSLAKGHSLRPVTYYIVEDIVAVNGGGGKAYRRALDDRYQTSPIFRQMIAEVNLLWGSLGLIGGVTTILLIALVNIQVSYGLAWSFPWLVAGLGVWITVHWVKKRLADEQAYYRSVNV